MWFEPGYWAARRSIIVWSLVGVSALIVVALVVAASWRRHLNLWNAATQATPHSRILHQAYLVEDDDAALDVTSVDAHVPGVRLISTNVGHGVHIAAGHGRWLRTTFRITNCRTAPFGPLPINIQIERWYGTETVTVQDHGTDYDDAWTACGRE